MFKENVKCVSRKFQKKVKWCFNNVSRKFCFVIFFLHGTHRSYPSRRKVCWDFMMRLWEVSWITFNVYWVFYCLNTMIIFMSDVRYGLWDKVKIFHRKGIFDDRDKSRQVASLQSAVIYLHFWKLSRLDE